MAVRERDLSAVAEAIADIDRMNESFRLHLNASGMSKTVTHNYPKTVERFSRFLKDAGMPRDVHNIKREHIEAYISSLLDAFPGRVATTQTPRTYYYHLRAFFIFLVDVYEELAINPMANMKPPQIAERIVGIVEEVNLAALLKSCAVPRGGGDLTQLQKFVALRDGALIRLMVDSGPRLAEVGSLSKDVDLKRRSARVMGKGRRERDIAFGAKTALALDKYLIARGRHPHADCEELWLGLRGPLTTTGIYQALTKRARKLGFHITPHMLRHSWAHLCKVGGMGDEDLMSLGGWNDPTMPRHYGRSAAAERAAQVHARISPGDRF